MLLSRSSVFWYPFVYIIHHFSVQRADQQIPPYAMKNIVLCAILLRTCQDSVLVVFTVDVYVVVPHVVVCLVVLVVLQLMFFPGTALAANT